MATKNLTTNLKLIQSVLTEKPTPAQLPLGYMAFGLVADKPSIWANYDGTVHDMIAEGTKQFEIVQSTGTSTINVMSQKTVTDELAKAEKTANKNKANGYAGLDANAKILSALLPDYIMSGLLFGGTIAQNGTATLSDAFKTKYSIATATLAVTSTDFNKYAGVYFIAQDTAAFTNVAIIGVANVSTGDWIISLGTQWSKIDNTDAVISVNGKTGAVSITLSELGGVASSGGEIGATKATFAQASSRANLASGETITTSFGKLMKWFTDLSAGIGFQTSVTSTQTPIATASARGAVIIPATSALSVDASGNADVKLGSGIKKNASNQLEADIIVTYGVI